jgi:hypothetical protein
LHLRRGEGMLSHLEPDVIKERVRQRESGNVYTAI